jgi:predicted transcriptional regulator
MTIDAGSIMTQEVITAGPDDTVRMLATLFTNHGISAVAVCDKDGTQLGVHGGGDVMRPLEQANQLRRDWWLGLLSSWNTWTTGGHVS